LQQKYGHCGEVGKVKPTFSWSWFLETDDSEVIINNLLLPKNIFSRKIKNYNYF